MVFTEQEISILSLFAMCRDVPKECTALMDAETLELLLLYRYIRYSRNGISIRVTKEGHELLQKASLDYPSDGQYRCSGSVLARRLNVAHWIFWLKRSGVNRFLQKPTLIDGFSFLPSFMLRREKGRNILGGSRFIGILYADKIAFTCYYVSDCYDGIYPVSEQRMFSSEFLTCRKKPKVIITGKTAFDELVKTSMNCKSTTSTAESYFNAVGKFKCEACFVPMNDNGFRQLKILSIKNYKKQIFDAVLPNDYELCKTSEYDALQKSTGEKFLISIDGNIPRLKDRSDERIHAIMLTEHIKTASRLLKGTNVIIHPVELKVIEQLLRITVPYRGKPIPYMKKEGEYLYAPIIKPSRKGRK